MLLPEIDLGAARERDVAPPFHVTGKEDVVALQDLAAGDEEVVPVEVEAGRRDAVQLGDGQVGVQDRLGVVPDVEVGEVEVRRRTADVEGRVGARLKHAAIGLEVGVRRDPPRARVLRGRPLLGIEDDLRVVILPVDRMAQPHVDDRARAGKPLLLVRYPAVGRGGAVERDRALLVAEPQPLDTERRAVVRHHRAVLERGEVVEAVRLEEELGRVGAAGVRLPVRGVGPHAARRRPDPDVRPERRRLGGNDGQRGDPHRRHALQTRVLLHLLRFLSSSRTAQEACRLFLSTNVHAVIIS